MFQGMLQYYGGFIPNLAKLAAPLCKFTPKGDKWVWTETKQTSFEFLKQSSGAAGRSAAQAKPRARVSDSEMRKSSTIVLVWFGLVWFGLVWFGLVWFGLVWFGLVWFGLVWFGLVWFGLVWFGLVWFGLVWFGLVWFGLVWFGLVWFGLVWFGLVWFGSAQ